MLNVRQKYLLDVMERLRYLRKDQLFGLFSLRFRDGEAAFHRDIRQLCYLNRLMETETFLLLPGRRRDDGVIAAVDVMLQFSAGREPEFTAGHGGCKLAFFLTGPEGKVSAFKVYSVSRGREALVSAQADADQGRIHTVLFQIEDRSQIPLLGTAHPFHFVLWEDGACRFLKGTT